MNKTSSIAARFLWPFLDAARRSDSHPDVESRVARALGISCAELRDPDTFVPMHRVAPLLKQWSGASGDRNIGLRAALLADSSHLGIAEYLARNLPTMELALAAGERCEPLLGGAVHFGLTVNGSRAYWRLWFDPDLAIDDLVYEFAMALGLLSVRRISGAPDYAPIEVHFMHREPADTSLHQQIFRCPLRFASPVAQIVAPARLLSSPLRQADPALARLLERQAQSMLAEVPLQETMQARVRAVLQRQSHLRTATISTIAKRLGVGTRTVSRQLQQEGTCFRELLDEVRLSRARRLLANGDQTMAQVAEELGFANAQSFQRAFRRWQGESPGEYRRAVRSESGQVPQT